MKLNFKWISMTIAALSLPFSINTSAIDASVVETEDKITHLLQKMTIEEKVGQLAQIDLSVITSGKKNANGEILLDTQKLNDAIHKYKVGSILNAGGKGISPAHWRKIITQIQDQALATKSRIPVIYAIDAIHGATYTAGATLFPHNIGMAASRNTELVRQSAKITAKEIRAAGIRWNFDPVLDIARQPLWPRFAETYGEDTHLISTMGVAAIEAYEEDGLDQVTAVASCMKHFVGYSDPASGKDRTPAYIPDIVLKEHYLPQFQAAIDAGASTIMINSASVNGIPVHASKALLTDLLRDEMGFKGLVVTDWEDIIRLHERHRVADSPRAAVKMAMEAGIDMSMIPLNYSFVEHLVDLVKSGEITEQRLDRSVANVLRLKYAVGLFHNAYPETEAIGLFNQKDYPQVALQAAHESITLLKNRQQLLPIPKHSKILLAGPAVNNIAPLNGAWSFSWQGDVEANYPAHYQTLLQAFRHKFGDSNVVDVAAKGYENPGNYDSKRLITMARDVDYIVLALGENAYAESPGVINDLNLDPRQLQLAKAAATTGKPIILVLIEGRPRIISSIEPDMDGILQAYQPGSQGAQAIADILVGDVNPSGILPYSYPRYSGDIVPYDRRALADYAERAPGQLTADGYNPQWPFGFGLSYSSFSYSGLTLSHTNFSDNKPLTVSVKVKNTSRRDGLHTVELYIRDRYASVSPSVKKLKRFQKIALPAGETKTVNFEIHKEDLMFIDAEGKWTVEPGKFDIMTGDLSVSFTY